MDIPVPDFGPHIEEILGYAVDWMNLLDDQRFFWVLAAFSLALTAILWVIKTVQKPPSLDI